MKYIFLLIICRVTIGQENVGQQVAGGIAGALINTFFPQLKQNSFAQNNQNVPDGPRPLPAAPAPAPAPLLPSRPSNLPVALTGLGRLPPVDFPHGFPPTFVGLTNPDNQNGFQIPGGLQGRTDLPSDYVYPFAPPGSVIRPDPNNAEIYSLGASSRLQQQNQLSNVGGLTPIDFFSQLQKPVDNSALLQPVGGNSLVLNNGQLAQAGQLAPVGQLAPPRQLTSVGQSAPVGQLVPVAPVLPVAPVANLAPAALAAPPAPVQIAPPPPVAATQIPSTAPIPALTPINPATHLALQNLPNALGPIPVQSPTQKPAINYGSNCPECIPIDLKRLAGPWIQV